MECHFTPEYTREFMFVGNKGKLEAFYNNEQEFKIKVWPRFAEEPILYFPPKYTGPYSGHGGGDAMIVEEFYDRLRAGRPSIKGVKGARDSAAIAIAAAKSEQTGAPVMIPDMIDPGDD